jgi:hypothetical protein
MINFHDVIALNLPFIHTLVQYQEYGVSIGTFSYTHTRGGDGIKRKTDCYVTEVSGNVFRHFYIRHIAPHTTPKKYITHDQFKIAFHNWTLHQFWEKENYKCARKFAFIEEDWHD